MNIWKRVQGVLPAWLWPKSATEKKRRSGQDRHLLQAADSLRQLLDDPRIPESVRASLEEDYRHVEAMSAKLIHGDIHIAVFGKVSTGKSSLLNALLGKSRFAVGPLHGVTQHSEITRWTDYTGGGVHLIDTPGIDELDGQTREQMAYQVVGRCDLVLFVADGDLTQSEIVALSNIAKQHRPLILVLNKADRYTQNELLLLLDSLRVRAQNLVLAENIVSAAAAPTAEKIIRIDARGKEINSTRPRPPALTELTARIWQILEHEGKTLAALNAVLFANNLNDEITRRIATTRRGLAEKVTRTYCLTKGIAVALNPIPVADLLAAATIDVALVRHLSQVYGLPMTSHECGRLIVTIVGQLAALMGAVWSVNLVSAALKGMSAGLSVAVTGGAQGALAWYATYLVGRTAEQYLMAGKSWGPDGPKSVVRGIVDNLDRTSILSQARGDILAKLSRNTS